MNSVIVGSCGHVISCALARRGVRRGAAKACSDAAESSAFRCGNSVGLTSILDRRQFL